MKPFLYIFWGLILVFIDINIYINILPDFIGYLLIALGSFHLVQHSSIFHKAKILAYILTVLSLPQIIDITTYQEGDWSHEFPAPSSNWVYDANWYWLIYDQAISILLIILVFLICQGIAQIAQQLHREDILLESKVTNYLFIGINIVYLSLTPFSMNFSVIPLLLIFVGIAYIGVAVYMLFMISKAHNMLSKADVGD